MTTQQLERPLNEVDEIAQRVQESSPDDWSLNTEERPMWDARRIKDTIRRVAQDPGVLVPASIVVAALAILLVALRGRRRPPRTAEDVLVERSREAFDRAREVLEAMPAKVASIDR